MSVFTILTVIINAENQVVDWHQTAENEKKQEKPIAKNKAESAPYDFNLYQIGISYNKQIYIHDNRISKSSRSGLHLIMNLTCNEDKSIHFGQSTYTETIQHKILEMKDDTDKNLLSSAPGRKIYINSIFNSIEKNEKGSVSINVLIPSSKAKFISSLKGYIVAFEAIERKNVKVENLSNKKLIKLDNIAELTITSVDKNLIYYTINYLIDNREQPVISFNLFTENGEKISLHNTSRSGSLKSIRKTVTTYDKAKIPKSAYATVTYTTKSKKIQIPFEFENIPLP